MYRQGLGDCFLLCFSDPTSKPFHLVIDSGVLKGTPDSAAKMREVAEDIKHETGGNLDALVVTHEHWDHVSGFTEARDTWKDIEIAEVWLAWTEDPDNNLAKKLRGDRSQRLNALTAGLKALTDSASLRLDGPRRDRIDGLLGFFGVGLAAAAEDGGGTKGALDYIVGRAKKPVYHEPGSSFLLSNPTGVRIYVLGPPEDEKKIKQSDPSSANPEVYVDPAHAFAFSGSGEEEDGGDIDRPFAGDIGTTAADRAAYDRLLKEYFPALVQEGRDPDWRRISCDDLGALERLALALDGDTNNTSLALAIELPDRRVLLFPADAQVGNWLSWQDYTWKVGAKSIHANDLLARTVLYKVGHHGSHNATLKEYGLEKMTHRDLMAFVPVEKAMAQKKRWNMPFPPLFQRLLEKTRGRVVLADATVALPDPKKLTELTATERKRFAQTVTASELSVDINL